MTVKDYDDPPLVSAELVQDEPDIDLSNPNNPPPTAPTASMVMTGNASTAAAQQSQAPRPQASTTTTTTTYTIPAPAGAAAAAATGVTAAKTIIGHLGRIPKGMTCPYCERQMVTRVRDQIDCVTITAFVILLLIFWPLFWLPFCVPACKTSAHYCPLCNRKIGETNPCT